MPGEPRGRRELCHSPSIASRYVDRAHPGFVRAFHAQDRIGVHSLQWNNADVAARQPQDRRGLSHPAPVGRGEQREKAREGPWHCSSVLGH